MDGQHEDRKSKPSLEHKTSGSGGGGSSFLSRSLNIKSHSHPGQASTTRGLDHGTGALPGGGRTRYDTDTSHGLSSAVYTDSSDVTLQTETMRGVGATASANLIDSSCDDVDGHNDSSVCSAGSELLCKKICAKINLTVEAIQREQNINQENVQEYLSASSGADPVTKSRMKAMFEKKNQKLAQNIAQLQHKLDEYQRRLNELKNPGTASGTRTVGVTTSVGHRPGKNMLRNVGQGLKDFFVRDTGRSREASPSGSREARDHSSGSRDRTTGKQKDVPLNTENRFGSSDSITTPPTIVTHPICHQSSKDGDNEGQRYGGQDDRSNSAKDAHLNSLKDQQSEDDASCSSVPDSMSGELHLSPRRDAQRDQRQLAGHSSTTTAHDNVHTGLDATKDKMDLTWIGHGGAIHNDVNLVLVELQGNQEVQRRLQATFETLKNQLDRETSFYRQSLEEERERRERLEEQINDLSELHQHEVSNIKQELASMQEKMEYQLDERTRDMQELLESCQTKISKMEMAQQHQQQLISMEGIENSNFRAILTKLINVMLALLAVILLLVSTIANVLAPFLANRYSHNYGDHFRLRILSTACLIVCIITIWKHWSAVTHFVGISDSRTAST